MKEIFLTFLNVSINGSILVAAVILTRFIFKRYNRSIICILWGLVALRMLIPVNIPVEFSLVPVAESVTVEKVVADVHITDTQPDKAPITDSGINVGGDNGTPDTDINSGGNNGTADTDTDINVGGNNGGPVTDGGKDGEELPPVSVTLGVSAPVAPPASNTVTSDAVDTDTSLKTDVKDIIVRYGSIVWLVGMACMVIYLIASDVRLRLKTRVRYEKENGVYLCDDVKSPFVMGVIRPRIMLPSSTDGDNEHYILMHERAHIERGDHIWKVLAFAVLTVHWYNPLVWLSFILYSRDTEMACDERVIRRNGTEIRKAYAHALLTYSMGKGGSVHGGWSFSQRSLATRIKGVLNYKKSALWVFVSFGLACIVLVVCFMTVPVEMEDTTLEDDGSSAEQTTVDDYSKVVNVLKEKGLSDPKVIDEAKVRLQNGTSANESEHSILLVADYAYGDSIYHNMHIVLRTDDELELIDLEDEFGSYGDIISVCDINGDGIDECILQQVLDMFGGAGQFMSRVISFTEDEVNVLFESDPGNLYDTGFRSEYLEQKLLRISNIYTGYTTQIDISGMFKDEYFNSNEEGINRPGIQCESFVEFKPKESNQGCYCEIECIQFVTLDGASLGYVLSILKYNSKAQTFDVINSEFLSEDEYYQMNRNPEGSNSNTSDDKPVYDNVKGIKHNVLNFPPIEQFSGSDYGYEYEEFPEVDYAVYKQDGVEEMIAPTDQRLVQLMDFLSYSRSHSVSSVRQGYVTGEELQSFLTYQGGTLEVVFKPLNDKNFPYTKIIIGGDNYISIVNTDLEGFKNFDGMHADQTWPYMAAVRQSYEFEFSSSDLWHVSWIDLLEYAGFKEAGNGSTDQGGSDISENSWYENIELDDNNTVSWNFDVYETDSSFYYCSADGIHEYDKDSFKDEVIVREYSTGFTVYDNKIYYCTEDKVRCYDIITRDIMDVWDEAQADGSFMYLGDIQIHNGYLYIKTLGTAAIRMSLNTGVSETFLSDFVLLALLDNDCYFIDHASRTFSIYHMECTTKEVSLLRGDGLYREHPPIEGKIYISDLAKAGDSVYYLMREEDQIYKLNLGGEDELIADFGDYPSDVGLSIFKGDGDSLYYSVREGQNESLYEYNADGTKLLLKVTGKTNFGDFVVTKSAIFYKIADGSPVICVARA